MFKLVMRVLRAVPRTNASCGVGQHYRCTEVENSKHPPVRTAPGDFLRCVLPINF